MFRTIVRIVKSTVAAAFKAMRRAALIAAGAVGGIFESFFGREVSLPEPDQVIYDVEQLEAEHLAHELQQVDKLAPRDPRALAYRFICADNIKRAAMDLSAMSPDLQSWVSRLTAAEALLVRKAGLENMLRHVDGKKQIAGVPAVKPRKSVADYTQREQVDNDLGQDLGFDPSMRLAM
ncbi:hypothetical protein [Dongia sp.]|uniref:hypothetical protein n=1 Tax=Dongia sp. TaxID=1977262 RepID=UPI0035AFE219